ncbi:MAG TPA: cob(I)yrinic acid a,c-diamide adenosyltransferase [Bdellovibrionales bacterium]|nr:cob(I)yrinic acid a,c-diamide adenosyltransferase [Bdellovibrionales bacterium]
MAKIYTKTGDRGETGLVGGQRVSKADLRLECYGTVDELNSVLGLAASSLERSPKFDAATKKQIGGILNSLQNELFNLGSRLASADEDTLKKMPVVHEDRITFMESTIDTFTSELPPLRNFILPGGTETAAQIQWARTVCRRAERWTVRLSQSEPVEPATVRYLNRLSDFLFVIGRLLNHRAGVQETIWKS